MSLEQVEKSNFDVIKDARQAIKQRNDAKQKHIKEIRHGSVFSTPAASTIAQYSRDTAAIFAVEDPWQKAANTKKVKTWQKRKSAMLCIAQLNIDTNLKEQDRIQRLGAAEVSNENHEAWNKLIKEIDFYTNILKTQPKDFLLKEVKQKSSKKNMKGLPDNWRMELLGSMTQSWKEIYIVQAVTGCRPAEIWKGVVLQVKDGKLNINIQGAKLSEYSGQKNRLLNWDIENATPLVSELIKLVQSNGGHKTINYSKIVSNNPASAYSTAVRDAGKRAFPKRPGTITPYTLRHAAASDLKDSGLSSDEQSKALGHQVSETKSVYGSKRYGKRVGSVAPQSAIATTKVRTKPLTNAAKVMTAKIKGTPSGPKMVKQFPRGNF